MTVSEQSFHFFYQKWKSSRPGGGADPGEQGLQLRQLLLSSLLTDCSQVFGNKKQNLQQKN